MTHVLGLLALVAVLFLGSGGWGRVVVALCRRAGWEGAAGALGPPLQVALGMSLFLVVGGVLVAADDARVGVLIGWHLVGCLLIARPLVRRFLRAARGPRRALVVGGSVVVIVALLVLVGLGNIFGGLYNTNDDYPAYIYLTKRLLATGGLIDPFNVRRMTSYGGSQLYLSLFLRVSGYSALRGFEFLYSPLLLVALIVGNVRRRWLLVGTLLIGLGVFITNGLGQPIPVTNLSPAFSAAALSFVVFQLSSMLRGAREIEQRTLYALIGLTLAGLLALRFTFLLATVVAVVVVSILSARRGRLVGIGVALGGTVVGSIGWAVASARSSGTPLFAFFGGNYNTHWTPNQNPNIRSFTAYAIRFRKAFTLDDVGYVAVACVLLAAIMWAVSIPTRRQSVALLGAGVGALFQLLVLTVLFTGSEFTDIARLEAPSVVAGALFAISILWPQRLGAGHRGDTEGTERTGPAPPPSETVRSVPRGAAALVAVGMGVLACGYNVVHKAEILKQEVKLGAHVVGGSAGFPDLFGAAVHQEYDAMNRLIPRGANVLASVTYPELLDFSHFTFATIDEVGAASPPPHLPLSRGAASVVRYLRELGYTDLVVDSPTTFGFYNVAFWSGRLHDPVWSSRQYARYILRWQGIVEALEHDSQFAVTHAGSLTLIHLR